jgi:hypothetical protein
VKLSNRQFERTWGQRPVHRAEQPVPTDDDGSVSREPKGIRYERLLRVTVFNTYFGPRETATSPTFSFQPTPSTAAFLGDLGLLFQSDAVSFSVFCPKHRIPLLLQYLRRERAADPDDQVWTRLSVLLVLTYPYFVNVSALPLATNPSELNFYFTNEDAHGQGGVVTTVVLNPGDFANRHQLVPVTGTQYAVETPEGVVAVEVRDLSGRAVLCVPRCVPKRIARIKPPDQLTCADAHSGEPNDVCRNVVYLDFSPLPEGRYTITRVGPDDVEVNAWPVLYTQLYPMPLCFVDLLLTNPTGQEPGVYPFPDLNEPTTFTPVDYQLHFERRSSLWNYYCVPPRGERYEDLVIESEFHEFVGPAEVILGDGRLAYAFRSTDVIPLELQSQVRLRLKGRPRQSPRSRTLVDRLPVASGPLVLPGDRHEPRAHSDIFVYL